VKLDMYNGPQHAQTTDGLEKTHARHERMTWDTP
jgi:hypothetical protein